MWEMIDRMFGDTLWIWTALVGSILGAMSVKWLRDTRIGLWAYGKFDKTLDFLRDRWGWTFLNQDRDFNFSIVQPLVPVQSILSYSKLNLK